METLTIAAWLQTKIGPGRMKQAAVAAELGVSQSLVSRWRRGESIPEPENCQKLARLFGETEHTVMAMAGYLTEAEAPMPERSIIDLAAELLARVRENEADFAVEVYPRGAIGSAGGRTFSNDDAVYLVRSRRLSRLPGGRQPLEVIGTCLEPDIISGQIVFVQPGISWRPRQIIAVRVNGGVQVKRLKAIEDGVLVLTSNDGDIRISDQDASIVGVVVAGQREFDW